MTPALVRTTGPHGAVRRDIDGAQHARARAQAIHRAATGGGGSPVPAGLRHRFEAAFGSGLGHVRIHLGPSADAAARAAGAMAYTVGRDIVFASGAYRPERGRGALLVAHEIAHTRQQGVLAEDLVTDDARTHPDLEHAAADAAVAAVMGRRASVSRHARARGLLQRAEHGTYISLLGTQSFLDAGERFYRDWGYPNVRRVRTVGEILDDLDRARGTIDRFRIVSHANPGGLQLGFLPSIHPGFFDAAATEFSTPERFRREFAGIGAGVPEFLSAAAIGNLLGELRADSVTGPLLTTIGVGMSTPDLTSPLGILIRALLEERFLADARDTQGGQPQIPAAVTEFTTLRINRYEPVVVSAAPAASQQAVRQAIRSLRAQMPAGLARRNATFAPLSQQEADIFGAGVSDAPGGNVLRPSLRTAIEEGTGSGPVLRRLNGVRSKITAQTHIEIRGCNIGSNPTVMDRYRAFFGRPNDLPSMTAPDLFQFFFQLGFQTFTQAPADQAALSQEWTAPGSTVPQEFEDWTRIRAREMVRVVNDRTLTALCTRYGLSIAEVRVLNPEIPDENALQPGQAIWLVARTVRAASGEKLEDIAQRHLRSRHAWPRLWSWNPQITDPRRITNAPIWIVPATARARVAAAPRTQADLRSSMAAGETFVKVDAASGAPTALLDDRVRARAIATWLAAQPFDARGRTAAALTRLYQANLAGQMRRTHVAFLSRTFPNVTDPIFPDDPRHAGHIIRRP